MLAAADSYSYIHLVLIAGIITFAAGVRFVVEDATAPLATGPRLMLCGGVAAYLLGHLAFRLRMVGTLGYEKLVVAVALLTLFAVGTEIAAWVVAGVIALLLAVLCLAETAADRRGERDPEDEAANRRGLHNRTSGTHHP